MDPPCKKFTLKKQRIRAPDLVNPLIPFVFARSLVVHLSSARWRCEQPGAFVTGLLYQAQAIDYSIWKSAEVEIVLISCEPLVFVKSDFFTVFFNYGRLCFVSRSDKGTRRSCS